LTPNTWGGNALCAKQSDGDQYLRSLNHGETMRFVNDHDPLPLLDQLVTRYGETVTIRYVQRDPGVIVIDFVKN
jgi:uncharacterized protein (DUF2249 family)